MEDGSPLIEWIIALALFCGLVGCLEVAFRFGRRERLEHAGHTDQLATVQAAILGILALLLGFSFALSAGRFNGRSELILDEANGIGTAWLRCDLLPVEQRGEVRDLLRRYIDERVVFYDANDAKTRTAAIVESEALQAGIWARVEAVAKATPLLADVILTPFNDLFDLHGKRVAAVQRHLPVMLLLLLLACSVVAVGAVGYGCGVAGKRNVVMTTALAFLVAAVLWAIIDLDHPRRGLIRSGQQPMLDLQKSLERKPALQAAVPTQ